MDKDLEQKIAERKQQALDRKIWQKGRSIAQNLGYGSEKIHNDSDAGPIHYSDYTFENDALKITHLWYTVEVTNKKVMPHQKVYEGACDEPRTYVPGRWELKIETLYAQSLLKEAEKIAATKETKKLKETQEEIDERAKWGL